MRQQWRGIDYPFLIFLILVTQGNLFIKPLAFLFVFFSTPKVPFGIKKNSPGFFYFVMLIYSLFSAFTMVDYLHESYLFVFVIGIGFWFLALIAYQYVAHLVQTDSLKSVEATIVAYFKINLVVCLWQLVLLVLEYKGNPYANMSSGDYVKGFFANSSVNMIVNSFFVFYFFTKKNYVMTFIAFIICLSTTYMSGLVILLVVTGYFVVTSARIRLIHRVGLVMLAVIVFLIFTLASPDNIRYATETLSSISSNKGKRPRKIVSFIQTAEYLTESPGNFLFGAGMGNFSSRLAFISDGEYVKWYPREFLYRSRDFTLNHYTLWNANVIFDRAQRGTSNQPFSIYNQMFGEYGVVGFLIMVTFYFGAFLKNYSRLTFARMLFVLTLGYFILDYWFEYFSITVILELMLLLDLKMAKSRQELAPEISKT